MSATVDLHARADLAPPRVIHPLWVRLTHWINAIAMVVMIGSGWEIYNASPLFGFTFPRTITIGGWLAGALLWHFAAMWLLVLNGIVYVLPPQAMADPASAGVRRCESCAHRPART
jgi:thiosulfate reductase cytochrome b subunit